MYVSFFQTGLQLPNKNHNFLGAMGCSLCKRQQYLALWCLLLPISFQNKRLFSYALAEH